MSEQVNQLEREKRDMNDSLLSLQTERKLSLQSKISLEKQLSSLQEALKEREESVRCCESKLNTRSVVGQWSLLFRGLPWFL